VRVANGDYVVGDADGTVVVPQDAPLDELCAWLHEHDERDRRTLELVGETGRLSAAYRKLGRI
jgi:regulator of RNase E activity RraA